MIRFKKYRSNNESNSTNGKWYGRAVHELVEFDKFIRHMANHHCVFSEAVIRGVLIEAESCLRELLLEGKAVRLDGIGIFRIGLETEGAETAAKFTANSIKGVRVNLYLGERFRAAGLFKEAEFAEAGRYTVDDLPAAEGPDSATEEPDGPDEEPTGPIV